METGAGKQLSDVMPVVVALGPTGLYAVYPKTGESEVLAHFPEDLDRVVFALSETYAQPMPFEWVKRKLLQLLHYLDQREAYLVEGDLVAIIDGKPYGLKVYPEVVHDVARICGNDMHIFMGMVLEMEMELRKELARRGE